MASEDLAPVVDEEPMRENPEICKKNFYEADEAQTVTGTHGKASDKTSLLRQNTSEDVPAEVEADPVPLIPVSVVGPATPDHEATDINHFPPTITISSEDDDGVLSKDLAYEKADSGNNGVIACGISLESVHKPDVSKQLNELISSESVSDGTCLKQAKGLDFDLNDDVYDEEVDSVNSVSIDLIEDVFDEMDSLNSVSIEESGYRLEPTENLSGVYVNVTEGGLDSATSSAVSYYYVSSEIKSSRVTKYKWDLNKMPANDDSHDLSSDAHNQMQPGYASNEHKPAFPTWSSARDFALSGNMSVNDYLFSSFGWNNNNQMQSGHWWKTRPYINSPMHPIYVSDDEQPAFPTFSSPLRSPLRIHSIPHTTNGVKPAITAEDDSVEPKLRGSDLKLFGHVIRDSENPIVRSGMKRKEVDCTLQLGPSYYKRCRLAL